LDQDQLQPELFHWHKELGVQVDFRKAMYGGGYIVSDEGAERRITAQPSQAEGRYILKAATGTENPQ
jgi:hypothetical protein